MRKSTQSLGASLLLAAVFGLSACSAPPGNGPVPSETGYEGPGSPDDCEASVAGEPLLRRLTRLELGNTLADVFPTANASATTPLPSDLLQGISLSNDASTLVMGTQMAAAILDNAERVAAVITESSELATRLPCSATADAACIETFINQFGEPLFRRPLTDEDRARYVALHTEVAGQSDFATGLKWVLVALIQSTHTVHRSEIGSSGKLTPYEIASQLSYNYSASPPSAELMAMALAGDLNDPNVRVAEAKKLLTSERGQEVTLKFFDEWLGLGGVETVTRANVPDDFETIKSKMAREADAFLTQLVYQDGGGISELLTANYTVADEQLAGYYGFSGGSGDLLTGSGAVVQRTFGSGVFAQGAVLTTMAAVDITSPTRRGLLLLERLYCEVPGLPEGVNLDLNAEALEGNTTRERLENSHLEAACQGCHKDFDPLGFAFENFDQAGRYRDQETNTRGTFDIDSTTTVAKLDDLAVNGQEELMSALASDPAVGSCVSGTMERYVYGSSGTCRAKDSRTALMKGELSLVDFLAQLAAEPHFVERM